METALKLKFTQHKDLKQMLLDTGDAELVEVCPYRQPFTVNRREGESILFFCRIRHGTGSGESVRTERGITNWERHSCDYVASYVRLHSIVFRDLFGVRYSRVRQATILAQVLQHRRRRLRLRRLRVIDPMDARAGTSVKHRVYECRVVMVRRTGCVR